MAPLLLISIVGRYAMRFNLRTLASITFVVMGTTCFLRSDFYLGIDFAHVAGMQLLMGFGVTLFFMPVTVIPLSDLKIMRSPPARACPRSCARGRQLCGLAHHL